jgi:hypothetical protein
MSDSLPIVTSLTVQPAFGQNLLRCEYTEPHANGLSYLRVGFIEFHAAAVNDRNEAQKVSEGLNEAVHVHVDGTRQFYWARPRLHGLRSSGEAEFGSWFPVSETEGIEAAGTASIALSGYVVLTGGLLLQWGRNTLFGGGASTAIEFPKPFSEQCFNVTASPNQFPSATLGYVVNVETFDVAGFSLSGNRVANGGAVSAPAMAVFWQALGK